MSEIDFSGMLEFFIKGSLPSLTAKFVLSFLNQSEQTIVKRNYAIYFRKKKEYTQNISGRRKEYIKIKIKSQKEKHWKRNRKNTHNLTQSPNSKLPILIFLAFVHPKQKHRW